MISRVTSRGSVAVAKAALSRSTKVCIRSSSQTYRSFVSATTALFEKQTMKVPTMGDSITEGTIVEWTVQVGQAVKEEDVVALIETDKVTVDIKATMAGVVTQQYGEVDDTVEVGADLCEIDTEATATVEASESSPSEAATASETQSLAAAPTPAPAPAPSGTQSAVTSGVRTPSINFLGKEGWARVLSGDGSGSNVVYQIPANYGRLSFSEEEMEALIMGGANIAPDVKDYSAGATFAA